MKNKTIKVVKDSVAVKVIAVASETYNIEKGIKVPKPSIGTAPGTASKVGVTLRELKKGDSFLIGDALEATRGEKVVRDRNRRERLAGRSVEFVTRRVDGGTRVWRVK